MFQHKEMEKIRLLIFRAVYYLYWKAYWAVQLKIKPIPKYNYKWKDHSYNIEFHNKIHKHSTVKGIISNIDTSEFNKGQRIYLDTEVPGKFTLKPKKMEDRSNEILWIVLSGIVGAICSVLVYYYLTH